LYFGGAHTTTDSPAPTVGPIGFDLLVHDFLGAPVEIDLDDARASLMVGLGYDGFGATGVLQHGLSGHLSLTKFSTGACPFAYSCLITAKGTFSFTATGADGQRTTVTNGTISARNETYQSDICPQQND
jgi:hypothetical protein